MTVVVKKKKAHFFIRTERREIQKLFYCSADLTTTYQLTVPKKSKLLESIYFLQVKGSRHATIPSNKSSECHLITGLIQ